ncbi:MULTISPECIES: muconolactone Delta-isomerase family protein [Kribbella]|jgi:muconolactone delta-isomerase|uniref:Muconolactone delta-isomerase n=1 Tax=Kribbella pratensis TaxID=2512112 RepID=A0ABY2FRL7_9ACTN|nr:MULTISPECIES: muconolactone Delta-isomerase family protein [Kribbella]TDW95424.1 muconolactone delta-isomerase [Kribbella pratensis]TDX08432.1 muconolactone delta-isomerase [Kribbella sp. VKM Ac-2566]
MEFLVTMTTRVPDGTTDAADLETVLASMPLRIWRTDEVTPLSPHPNDPAAADGRV